MATIRDVAKKAGVSVATVSRYLNGSGYVSKEAELAVAAAVSELRYEVNSIARSLNTKNSNLIGLILPDITNPFFPELARAVEDVALTYGYTVVLCNSDEKPEKEQNYIETLKRQYISGFIVISNQQGAHYASLSLPIVALDRTLNDNVPTVASNNKEGAILGTLALLERGCRNILFLKGPEELNPANERYEGFVEAVTGSGVSYKVVTSPFHFADSERITEEILKSGPHFDGIFASSDISAAGALKAARKLGISVPEDLQILGFDGIAMGEMLSPGLSTVAQDIYKMGAIAARMLIKQIEKKPIEQYFCEVPVQLKMRGTTRRLTE